MGTVVSKTACPKCRADGGDSAGDNLSVYDNGSGYCHAGHGYFKASELGGKVEERTTHKVTVADCLTYPLGADPKRKLSADVVDYMRMRVSFDTTTGVLKRQYYQYGTDEYKPTGFKVRLHPEKSFFVVGKLGGCYGWYACSPEMNDTLMIVEGEEDVAAAKEMLNGTKLLVDVVSLPNGANLDGKLDADTLSDESKFKRYKNIAIVLDNDEPGVATAQTLANWLCPLVDKVKIVTLHQFKDSSDYWMNGKGGEWRKEVFYAKQFSPEGVIRGSEITVADIVKSAPKGFDLPYKDLNDKLQGVRKGEILTVCAASGIGKSTLVNEIAYNLVTKHSQSVCHIALENVYEATAATYVAMDCGVPVARFRSDPSCLTTPAIEDAMDRTVRKMFFFKHFGSIDTFKFRSKLMYYARLGVDFIILDHLNMVISGTDTSDERKELDKMMTFLASIAVSTGVGIINVVHLKRREHRDGKGLNEGGQVSLTDLRGSAGLEQLSWAVIAMERNQQAEDGSEDFSSLRVLKNRTWGRTGRAGRLKYCHDTGRLIDCPEQQVSEVHSVEEKEEEVLKETEELSGEALGELLARIDVLGPKERVQEESTT